MCPHPEKRATFKNKLSRMKATNVGIQCSNRRCDPCSRGLCNLPTLTIDEFRASSKSVLQSGFWQTLKVVYRGRAIFVGKAFESFCVPNPHQCPGQPSLHLHRHPLSCSLRGGGAPPSPRREMEEENAQAPEARKDTSAGKGGGEQNQGKKSRNRTRERRA